MENNTTDIFELLKYAHAPQCLLNELEMYLSIAKDKQNEESEKPYAHDILFVPVCGNCGMPVTDTVDVERVFERDFETCHVAGWNETVTPYKCKRCKTYFNHIIMPRQLPFKGYFNKED